MAIDYQIFDVFAPHVDFNALESGSHIFKSNRFHVLYGGRASGKSVFVAQSLILEAYMSDLQILCGRQLQNSISDSSISLMWEQVENWGLEWFFTKTKTEITGQNGSRIWFRGVGQNYSSIKSISRIDRLWIEEG